MLLDPEVERMAREAERNIARAEAKWRAAFRDPNTRYEARAGIERPTVRGHLDPMSPAELMARVGGYAPDEEWPL